MRKSSSLQHGQYLLPTLIEQHRGAGVLIGEVQRVVMLMHHRMVLLVEEEPGGVQHAVRSQNSDTFSQIIWCLLFRQMGKDGMRVYQSELRIAYWERRHRRAARYGIEHHIENIMVQKGEMRRNGLKVSLAPADHSRMKVDAYVHLWSGTLLQQLSRNPSAAAAEVEHLLVKV